jgi:uncharacterized protein (TIGR03437 family)
MSHNFSWKLAALVALIGSQIISAQPSSTKAGLMKSPHPNDTAPHIIPMGSALNFGGTNAPDTYSAKTTFSSTPVVVDNGAVKIWQEQVPTGTNAEWDIFHLQTTNGGPLAGNINAYWDILMDYTLSVPVFFDQVVQQWTVNGTPVSPITDGIGSICCAKTSNPILPGAGYYNSGFSVPYPAGFFTNWKQVFVSPYNFVSAGGISPNAANGFNFALHFTIQPGPPVVSAAISASAFGGFKTFAPGSWIEIYGTDLALPTQTWANSDFNGVNAPTALGGTSVSIGGLATFVDYVSPLQVNVQVPLGVGTGTQPLIVTTAKGSSAPFNVTVDASDPGLLAPASFNVGGTQYVAALFSDGTTFVLPPGAIPGITSRRAKPGDTIMLYGVDFGSVNPNIPPGQIAQQINSLASPFTVSIGGTQATTSYDGLAPTYVGLYQFNVVVPEVAASDSAPVTFTLNGVSGTQKLAIAVGN